MSAYPFAVSLISPSAIMWACTRMTAAACKRFLRSSFSASGLALRSRETEPRDSSWSAARSPRWIIRARSRLGSAWRKIAAHSVSTSISADGTGKRSSISDRFFRPRFGIGNSPSFLRVFTLAKVNTCHNHLSIPADIRIKYTPRAALTWVVA